MLQTQISKRINLPSVGRIDVARVIDCRGMTCPKPQMVVRKELMEMEAGQIAEVLIDNPVEGSDTSATMVSAVIKGRKAILLHKVREGDIWRIYFQKR